MTLEVLDATATKQGLSTTVDAQGNLVGSTCVTDPITGAKQQVGTQYSGDSQSVSGNAALTSNIPLLFNGATFDRARGNVDVQPLAISGASAQTINSSNMVNINHRGAQFGVNISQLSASTTLQITVQGLDVASGTWYTVLQSAAFNAVGFTQLTVYPGATASANVASSQPLPRTWRISATIVGSGTATATIGASLVL